MKRKSVLRKGLEERLLNKCHDINFAVKFLQKIRSEEEQGEFLKNLILKTITDDLNLMSSKTVISEIENNRLIKSCKDYLILAFENLCCECEKVIENLSDDELMEFTFSH